MEDAVQRNLVETEDCIRRFSATRHKIRVSWYECNKREKQTGKRIGMMHSVDLVSIKSEQKRKCACNFIHVANPTSFQITPTLRSRSRQS